MSCKAFGCYMVCFTVLPKIDDDDDDDDDEGILPPYGFGGWGVELVRRNHVKAAKKLVYLGVQSGSKLKSAHDSYRMYTSTILYEPQDGLYRYMIIWQ